MMNARLARYVAQIVAELAEIPEKRKRTLEGLAQFVRDRHAVRLEAQLTFICTHNSRRSHFAQIWAATAAANCGVNGVATNSAGTEATAFNPRAFTRCPIRDSALGRVARVARRTHRERPKAQTGRSG